MSSRIVVWSVIAAAAAGAALGVLFTRKKSLVTARVTDQGSIDGVEGDIGFDTEPIDATTREYEAIKEGTRAWVERQKQDPAQASGTILP